MYACEKKSVSKNESSHILKKIDEHFIKYQLALDEENDGRINYYNKEIEFGFFDNLDKAASQIHLDEETKQLILDRKTKRHEIKHLPLS